MAVPPALDDRSGVTEDSGAHDSQFERDPQRTAPAARRLIAALLVVAVLASAGTLVWLVSQRTGEADDLQAEREKVMSQARLFILRVNTYGPDLLAEDGTMPDYRELVLDVITDKFAADFEETVPAAEATVEQAEFAREAEVYGVGVSVIDSDSATALVAGSFTNSYPDPDDDTQRIDDLPLPFRVEIELVKVDGEWLVDNFTPVTGDEETSEATPSGSPSETAEPSAGASSSGTAEPSEEASP